MSQETPLHYQEPLTPAQPKIAEDTAGMPTYDDVLDAVEALKGQAHITQVLTSTHVDDELGLIAKNYRKQVRQTEDKEELPEKIRVFFKCENFQKTGSFKFRGAFNAISKLSPEQKAKGVLAYSAGNHGQGVALSGRIFNIKTRLIVPKDAPKLKLDAMRGYGAELVYFDRYTEDIDEVIEQQTQETGMTFVSPFDNYHVIAGQGTVAKELIEQVGDLDHIIMGIGGGGLISGCAIAAKALLPNIKVHGVEPDAADDAAQSLAQNKIVSVLPQETIADGASTPHIGEMNLPIMRKYVDSVTGVSDEELIDAMRLFSERCKIIAEPTGCLGLAAVKRLVRSGVIKPGEKVGCLITGGNIDMQRYTRLLAGESVTRETVPKLASASAIVLPPSKLVPEVRQSIDTSSEKLANTRTLGSDLFASSSGDEQGCKPSDDEDIIFSPTVNTKESKSTSKSDDFEPRKIFSIVQLRKLASMK